MSSQSTNVTRYLCAAAYLDSGFRNYVIDHLVEETYKVAGISYGVDLLAVVKHCLNAQKRATDLSLKLAFLLVVILILSVAGGVFWLLGYGVAVVLVATNSWDTRYKILAKSLLRDNFNPDAVSYSYSPRLEQRIQEAVKEQDGNVIVYGGYSPFVGAGFDIGGWSFAINTSKGKEEMGKILSPVSFTIKEAYDAIENALKSLNLKDLEIKDKLCVSGRDIRNSKNFLASPFDRPFTQVDPTLVELFREKPTATIRHYQCLQLTTWRGELILSIFLRFAQTGQNLFVEASYFLLPPLKSSYYEVDTLQPHPTSRQIVRLISDAFVTAFFAWILSPLFVFALGLARLTRSRRREELRRIIRENASFDYGATTTMRMVATSEHYQRYFQKLDKEMYMKIVERQILDTIINFLDSKNIDISDLKERQTAILNNGVIISGGSIKAESFSVGEQAKSIVNHFAKGLPAPTGNS